MGSKNKDRKNSIKTKKKNKSKTDSNPPPAAEDGGNNVGSGSKKIITDARFASMHTDPRFQKVPQHKSKVAIDSRFNRMFTDKSFASSSTRFDKRGKPKKKNSESSLRHYYRLEEEQRNAEERRKKETAGNGDDMDDDSEEDNEESEGSELSEKDGDSEGESSELSEKESGEESGSESGEESGSTTEEEIEDVDIVYDDGEPEIQEENIPVIEKETRRLAVVNMDWRHVKAVDLYVLLSSFLPKGGQILSVSVYPSEFGLQRMKEEEIHGPVGLFDDENEKNDDDNDEIDNEKLRAYERSRLRYYYAVVECDSSATADYLYKACDGVEFERSANVLDLRFIPDTMEFKHPPRDVATEEPAKYEGLYFQTQALQQSKIHLSWDEDEPQRVKTLKRKFNDEQLAELELKEFLASDESESDDDENDNISEDPSEKKNKKKEKYLALLQSGDGSDGDGEEDGQDMEVTFNSGLEDISKRILEKKDKKSETVWEAYLRKRREKKKARKNKSKNSSDDGSSTSDTDREPIEEPDDFFVEEPSVKRSKKEAKQRDKEKEKEAEASRAELELLLTDDKGADTGLKGYNLKPKKAKGKRGKEVPDEDKIPTVEYNDPRFSALFTSPLFALDPTDPQFKRSAAYARQTVQRQHKEEWRELVGREQVKSATNDDQLPSGDHRTKKGSHEKSEILQSKKEKHELGSLVRSVKFKSKQVQLASNGKSKKDDESLSRGVGQKEEKHDLSTLVQSLKKKSKAMRK
ncbi:hypothetical protein SLE2022_009580 [Rubroshorea leprosula]